MKILGRRTSACWLAGKDGRTRRRVAVLRLVPCGGEGGAWDGDRGVGEWWGRREGGSEEWGRGRGQAEKGLGDLCWGGDGEREDGMGG